MATVLVARGRITQLLASAKNANFRTLLSLVTQLVPNVRQVLSQIPSVLAAVPAPSLRTLLMDPGV